VLGAMSGLSVNSVVLGGSKASSDGKRIETPCM
jgi:hypothetical protein